MKKVSRFRLSVVRIFLAAFLGVFIGLPAKAQGSSMAMEFFAKANALYESEQYDSAIVVYEKILAMGKHDPSVYYNLGNSLFRKNEIGQAILHYEKAKYLDPKDPDISANLKFAYMATVDKRPPLEAGFFEKVVWKIHAVFSSETQSILILVHLYLFMVLLVLWKSIHVRFRGILLALSVVFGTGFLVLAPSFFYKVNQESKTREAVVLSERVDAKNAPDGPQVLFTVHEGTKFLLGRQVGAWHLVSLDNGVSGWVHEDDLGLIEVGF